MYRLVLGRSDTDVSLDGEICGWYFVACRLNSMGEHPSPAELRENTTVRIVLLFHSKD